MMKKFDFAAASRSLFLALWGILKAYPIPVTVILFVSLSLVWRFRKQIKPYLTSARRIIADWIATAAIFVVAAHEALEAYGKATDTTGYVNAALIGLVAVWTGLEKRKSIKTTALAEMNTAAKNLAEQVAQMMGDPSVRATVMKLGSDGSLTTVATSYYLIHQVKWAVGQGVWGRSVEMRQAFAKDFTQWSGKTFENIISDADGSTPYRVNREQWAQIQNVRSAFSFPICSDLRWVIGVVSLESERPLAESGLDQKNLAPIVQGYSTELKRQLERI